MKIIKINPQNPSSKAIKTAVEVIKKGGVVIYPTDTIYGIGVNALDKNAIDKLYEIKERPAGKPLSVVISDISMAKKYCIIEKKHKDIFSALFPGAFTLIFPAKPLKNNKILTEFNGSLSIRIPDFKITAHMAKMFKKPFTATSANISGLSGSGDLKDILKQLENKKNLIDLVLDAGVLPKKDPSIIINLVGNKPKIIRK